VQRDQAGRYVRLGRGAVAAAERALESPLRMEPFFQTSYKALVESPNGTPVWWHSLPLPDGNRVNGNNPDKALQLKMWRAMQIPDAGGLAGKRVLDIGRTTASSRSPRRWPARAA
jgi:hypothetical protein